MLEEHNKRDKEHLMNLIGRRSCNTPNFALLIGAGASASSGVKTAKQMIGEWRQQVYAQSKSNEPFEPWLKKQYWHGDDEEYAMLFEKICDQRSQRRIYIEECTKDAAPSWGYIYLSNMIAHNYFNVIFTPNFDDLMNETCFLYADLKPIVCAHDSAVTDIRVTSTRPKIIKLHGDFLYGSIKDAIRETETLEKNMREKFMQFSREYGLIVIGYNGNDKSIMDILHMLLRSDGYFPHGVYWCIRNRANVNKKVERLMREENTYWIEIEGFDEFMAELHEMLELPLPDVFCNPHEATLKRLDRVIPPLDVEHVVIKKDVTKVKKQIEKFKNPISRDTVEKKAVNPVSNESDSHLLLGDIKFMNKDYKNALIHYKKALIQNPGNLDIMRQIVLCYGWSGQFEESLEMSEKMIENAPIDWRGYFKKGDSLIYLKKAKDAVECYNKALKCVTRKTISQILVARSNAFLSLGKWKEALKDAEKALKMEPESHVALINKGMALKKLGRKKEAQKILQDILCKTREGYHRACIFAVLGEKENMLKELKEEIKKDRGRRVDARIDAEFVDYWEDPDFQNLVYGKR